MRCISKFCCCRISWVKITKSGLNSNGRKRANQVAKVIKTDSLKMADLESPLPCLAITWRQALAALATSPWFENSINDRWTKGEVSEFSSFLSHKMAFSVVFQVASCFQGVFFLLTIIIYWI